MLLGRGTSPLVSCHHLVLRLEAPHSSLLSFHSPHSAPSVPSSTRVAADGRPHRHRSIAVCQSSATICDPQKLVFSAHLHLFYGKSQSTPRETPRWQQGRHKPKAERLAPSSHASTQREPRGAAASDWERMTSGPGWGSMGKQTVGTESKSGLMGTW